LSPRSLVLIATLLSTLFLPTDHVDGENVAHQ